VSATTTFPTIDEHLTEINRRLEAGEQITDEDLKRPVVLPSMCARLAVSGIVHGVVTDKETGEICLASPDGFVRIGTERDLADLAILLINEIDDEDLIDMVRSAS
jgi:hypothetical protein